MVHFWSSDIPDFYVICKENFSWNFFSYFLSSIKVCSNWTSACISCFKAQESLESLFWTFRPRMGSCSFQGMLLCWLLITYFWNCYFCHLHCTVLSTFECFHSTWLMMLNNYLLTWTKLKAKIESIKIGCLMPKVNNVLDECNISLAHSWKHRRVKVRETFGLLF